MKTYSELRRFSTFLDRYRYLQLHGHVGEDTFGFDRWLNQKFYRSSEWKAIRQEVILRDNACDLGCEGFEIHSNLLIHHMNPITARDIVQRTDLILNPEYLICVSFETHQAIHFGDESLLPIEPESRKPNDTCPWRA